MTATTANLMTCVFTGGALLGHIVHSTPMGVAFNTTT
jgi:hypothetical protein